MKAQPVTFTGLAGYPITLQVEVHGHIAIAQSPYGRPYYNLIHIPSQTLLHYRERWTHVRTLAVARKLCTALNAVPGIDQAEPQRDVLTSVNALMEAYFDPNDGVAS